MDATRWGVLVGIDGSEASLRAVEWVAADTAGTDAAITICFVVDLPVLIDVPAPHEVRENADHYGRQTVDRALIRLHHLAPTTEAKGHLISGNPAAELLRMSAEADQVVLGSHGGGGGFRQMVLGSVGAQVAAHAPCPVVVVRGERRDGQAVVVGVDGSPLGERALEYAFDFAARHGLGVRAIHAYPSVALVPPVPATIVTPRSELRQAAELLVERSVDAWSIKFPAVSVEPIAVPGSAAAALTEASKGSNLLVVGSRGHGGFAGLLLGSVSQAVLRHSDCPVAIVR